MQKQRRLQRGQAIVEYTAMIAFVCVMIALAFNIAQGSFFGGISTAYSGVNGSLNTLNQAALGTTH